MPVRKSSRQVAFINTSPPEDRVQLLKPLQEIDDMEDDSDEVYAPGLIKRYIKRPVKFENLSLADWAAWHDSPGKPYSNHLVNLILITTHLRQACVILMMMMMMRRMEVNKKNKKRSKARII